LPSGVTFTDNGNGTATLAGKPASSSGGTYTFTITAANGVSPNATQSFTLTVDQAPAITSANNATFTPGTNGTFTVTTTGYPHPTLSDGAASLPSGVTFEDNGNGTATLAGKPATGSGGTYKFTITASNGVGANATQSFTLTVQASPTTLTAAPQLVELEPFVGVGSQVVQATLTSGGSPVAAGQLVSFSYGATPLCTATTNAAGVARCFISAAQQAALYRTNAYTASFAGNAAYKASTSTTPVVTFF
jgi:hypothetical protein